MVRFLALLLFASGALAQTDWSKVEVKTTKVSDTVYILEGRGGNIGLSVGEDVFVIDDQFAELSEKIVAAVKAITPKPIRFVVNTHWHFDHTGGNEPMAKLGAVIVAHENVRKRMSTEQMLDFTRRTPPSPAAALPIVTFAQGVSFHLNGEELRVIHMPPAHTDGDAIVHFVKSDVIHMGDIYFNGSYPFIDTSSGGSVDGVIAACDRVIAMAGDNTKIIPGHGPVVSNKVELKAYRDMLAEISQRIAKMIAHGMKMEEVVAARPTADFDEKWGKGFLNGEKFTQGLVVNLMRR
jgi:cyclase